MVESGKTQQDENIQKLNEFEQKGIHFRENFKNRIRQLGGSANLWANQLMILKESDINNRDWITKDFAWPFTYSDLKSLYEDVINNVYYDNFKNLNYFNSEGED
jgi:hypothetical protein